MCKSALISEQTETDRKWNFTLTKCVCVLVFCKSKSVSFSRSESLCLSCRHSARPWRRATTACRRRCRRSRRRSSLWGGGCRSRSCCCWREASSQCTYTGTPPSRTHWDLGMVLWVVRAVTGDVCNLGSGGPTVLTQNFCGQTAQSLGQDPETEFRLDCFATKLFYRRKLVCEGGWSF